MDQTESILLNLIKAGDVTAFETLFNTHYANLCIYAKKMCGDMDDARDIVQTIFISVFNNRDSLAITTSAKSYLYKSVYHACLNHVKQHKVHAHHHQRLKDLLPIMDDQDTMINAELEEKIWAIVQTLPEQCRRIFEMNRFEGKKNREIAETLGISIRTVETQLSKALKIMREHLIRFLAAFLLLSLSL